MKDTKKTESEPRLTPDLIARAVKRSYIVLLGLCVLIIFISLTPSGHYFPYSFLQTLFAFAAGWKVSKIFIFKKMQLRSLVMVNSLITAAFFVLTFVSMARILF